MFKISGGTSASTFSFKISVAVPYAESAPWISDCSKIWASSIQASTSSGYCSVTFLRWAYKAESGWTDLKWFISCINCYYIIKNIFKKRYKKVC